MNAPNSTFLPSGSRDPESEGLGRLAFLCALCVLCCGILTHPATAQAQQLRFQATPSEVFEGDAVTFHYRNDLATVTLDQIASWKWDFNDDGVWDVERSVGEIDPVSGQPVTSQWITATWHATLDESLAVDGVQRVLPRLEVTTTGGQTHTQHGATENVVGPAGVPPDPDEEVTVKKRSVGNADMIVNFTVSPRLAKAAVAGPPAVPAELVRLYSAVSPAPNRTLVSLSRDWLISPAEGGAPISSTAANPQLSDLAPGSYDVSLTATYTVTYPNAQGGTITVDGSLTETKRDAFRVVAVPPSLQLGRSYRRGFPETFGWDDIIAAYQALGPGNNRYVYFNHFEDAFFALQGELSLDPANPEKRREMAEIVNELLQGQLLIANQRLIEALRIKYPRLAANLDENSDRLNPPAGAREETAAIDHALLDYQLALYYAGTALQIFGADILRVKAPKGQEPFPQFPQYLTFVDPLLSQAAIPIKNEYWQLTTLFERLGLGRMEKAKKLYRLSAQDATALAEAKEEAKTAGLHSYLGMAVLAAGQDERDYRLNEGNNLLANVKNARDLFERINAGLNPLGNDGSFIPNESFSAIYQDAQEAVADAREAEVHARQEERTWERYQAELRSEHLSQRAAYLTPLRNLTSIDPALYNDLRTVDDQRDYRAVVQARLQALITDYPNADPRILGELGANVIAVMDAGQGVEMAKNDLENLMKRIDLAKWGNTSINAVIGSTTRQLQSTDLVMGTAEGMLAAKFGLSTNPFAFAGGVLKGVQSSLQRHIQSMQTMQVNDISLEREIRGMALELSNLGLAIDRSNNNLGQAQLALDNQLSRMDRLIEDLAHTRETAADLYFQDPSFRVVVSQAMRRAEAEMDYAIDRLYRLAKTLEYEWTEAYQNPLIIPVNSQEPASLENPLFDKFTKLDGLFFVRNSDEAKDYLDALKAWDSKLRRINVTTVRGPNHSGPVTAEPISVRETVLNLRPDPSRGYTLDDSIRDFRNYLATRRVPVYFNPDNPALEIPFQTTIEDNRFFPATGSRWNMRVHSIGAEIYAESGFSNKQVAEIDLIQSGIVSLRRYWAQLPMADDVMKLSFNVDNLDRTAFAIVFPARINGATGGRPLAEFDNLGLKGRPVAATNWILRINTEGTTNREIEFSRIKDIVLRFTYTFGNPPEFPGF